MNPLLSLCVPSYGVSEWVFPVLDSIFCQENVSEDEYEVVVTDNGQNEDFFVKMQGYLEKHSNLIYKKTNAILFLNEIESYKLAQGQFIKFVNHRTLMVKGSLHYLISFVKENMDKKPFVYFANGMLYKVPEEVICKNFDSFVSELGYWSSWSTGMAIWKEDFNRMNTDISFNFLFPHTTILFSQPQKNLYIIDNRHILDEMKVSSVKKGKYDLFYAFSVEYPGIICDLLRNHDISLDTFKKVKDDILEDIARLYWRFVIKKEPCSYDVSNYKSSICVYFSRKQVFRKLLSCAVKKVLRKMHLK